MHLILNAPMLTDPRVETLGIGLGAGDVEADLLGGFSVGNGLSC